jgi:hypothetical protein
MNQPIVANGRVTSTTRPPMLETLLEALLSERHLIEELLSIVYKQREAVAADDLQGVDDSVFGVQRVLLTLNEARKRRRTINVRLGFDEDIPLRQLVELLGPLASEPLKRALDDLQKSARSLSREVAVNRQVLREALNASDDYVRLLTGAAAPKVGYGEGVASARDTRGAAYVVNRRA